jgi:hypothetical protein
MFTKFTTQNKKIKKENIVFSHDNFVLLVTGLISGLTRTKDFFSLFFFFLQEKGKSF